MLDTFKHKGLRKKLVEELRKKGILNAELLQAMEQVPRHFFLDSVLAEIAYRDQALPISCGQTISQPYTVAFQTQLLEVKPGEKVLEVGTGSGYQTSILCALGAKVYTIERQKGLYVKAKSFLSELGYFPKYFYGDGYLGLPAYAPFDKVLITCGAKEIPQVLIQQLKQGGRMVIPVGEGTQEMLLLTKTGEEEFETSSCGTFCFVPMLENKQG